MPVNALSTPGGRTGISAAGGRPEGDVHEQRPELPDLAGQRHARENPGEQPRRRPVHDRICGGADAALAASHVRLESEVDGALTVFMTRAVPATAYPRLSTHS
jgi:hypothetical protein